MLIRLLLLLIFHILWIHFSDAQIARKNSDFVFKNAQTTEQFAKKSLETLNREKEALEKAQEKAKSNEKVVLGYKQRIALIDEKIHGLQQGLKTYIEAKVAYNNAQQASEKESAIEDALVAQRQIETYRLNLSALLSPSDLSYSKQKRAFKDLTDPNIFSRISDKKTNIRLLDLNKVAINIIGEANKRAYELLGTSYLGDNKSINATLSKVVTSLNPSLNANFASVFALSDFDKKISHDVQRIGYDIDPFFAKQVLHDELELLNVNYQKVVNAIKKIDAQSSLPNELTLDSLHTLATFK